jgi:hypothetical protein
LLSSQYAWHFLSNLHDRREIYVEKLVVHDVT